MKKLFNKKFILILVSAIALLLILTIAMIFLTKENKKSFSRDGYIIASQKEDVSVKYYFDEGTDYKTNISSQLVFTDNSGEKVNVETDNFLHYIDGGIKFLKNGVIMDLDNVNATIVPYYNITNKSVLEYTNKSYYIETLDKTLAFNNIIGRISDNKYIVAGVNVKLQLAGNENIIEGDYFEITYIEDGVIRVENQEVSYQTTAQNSYILVNDDTKIDLGTKKIYYNEEEKMSITQMTIDGNENIEIVSEEEDNGSEDDGSNDKENENANIETPPTVTPEPDIGDNNQDGNQNQTGDSDGEPGEDEEGDEGTGNGSGNSYVRDASIEMVEAEVGVNNINAKFIINDPDDSIKSDLVYAIINMDTGKQVLGGEIKEIFDGKEFWVSTSSLSPDANYLLTINENNDEKFNTQYFQKLFRTDSLGIKLEKKYVTSNSIAYTVDFGNSAAKSVTLTLYDSEFNPVAEPRVVKPDSNLVLFENLTSNTNYNLKLNNVILENCEYNEVYTINKTIKTLKKTPYISGLISQTDDETSSFTIGINEVKDDNESIKKYTYYIYKAEDITKENIENNTLEPVMTIVKDDNSNAKINIDGEKILPKTNYKFKLVVEYHDNEKYGEIETEFSNNLILTGKPYVEFVPDEERTSFNAIAGTVRIIDESCTVPISGRRCYSKPYYVNNFILEYGVTNSTEKQLIDNVNFDPNTLEFDLEIGSLLSSTEYTFNLYGDVDLLDGQGIREGYLIGTFRASTTITDVLTAESWKQNESSKEELIDVNAKITNKNNNDLLANSMKNMTFNLYAGNVKDQLNAGIKIEPIATKTVSGDLKDIYYNSIFTINTTDTFGFVDTIITDEEGKNIPVSALDMLKSKTGDKLQEHYTIEITDIYDEGFKNEIIIENGIFVYTTPGVLIAEDENLIPSVTAEPVLKQDFTPIFDEYLKNPDEKITDEYDIFGDNYDYLSDTTIVAYKVNITGVNEVILRMTSLYKTVNKPVKKLIYYACDADKNPNCSIEEAVATYEIDLTTEEYKTDYVFTLGYGTKYATSDSKLVRGHNYVFKAKFLIDTDDDKETDTSYPSTGVSSEIMKASKQSPTYSIQIVESTEDKVLYRYQFTDYDNALYENKIYYEITKPSSNADNETSDGTEEGTTEEVIPTEKEELFVELSNGQFELTGLETDDGYTISYKIANIKKSSSVTNVKVGQYIFDGKFSYTSDTVKFENVTYDDDNRLRILIKPTDANKQYLVDRISAYHIVLSANGVSDSYEKVLPTNNTTTCTIDEVNYRCIIVDYADIKEFKSKDVKVKVTAYYDTGIIDNNIFKNKATLTDNPAGYILQANNQYNAELTRASYISFTDSNKTGVITQYPSGIYDFDVSKSTGNSFYIRSKINLNSNSFYDETPTAYTNYYLRASDAINMKLGSTGASNSGKNQSVNNKLLNKVELNSNDNTFKFNNIIPKIKVVSKAADGLVNGANVTIIHYGISESILKDEFKSESDGKYYYYLNIYSDEEKTELIRKEKVEISLESTGTVLNLTKYMPNTTYYFDVSAILKKEDGSYKETLLFDNSNGYVTKTYSFSSLKPELILYDTKFGYSSTSEQDQYLKRTLNLEVQTEQEIGEYEVKIEFYDNINNKLLLEKTVTPYTKNNNYYDSSELNQDVTDLNLIFGQNADTIPYLVKATIYTEACTGTTVDTVCDTTEKQPLEIYNNAIGFTPLSKPIITIDKEQNDHSLGFNVTVTDTDRVINDGTYCVQLFDAAGYALSGSQYGPICGLSVNNDGTNNEFSFDGLNSDTLYTFRVYTNITINNINETNKQQPFEESVILSTSVDKGVSLGSVAAYGNSYSISLLFSSGVNVTKITEIDYSIVNTNTKQNIASGSYKIGTDINFEPVNGNLKLVIAPSGLKLDTDTPYYIVVKYYINGEQFNPSANYTYTIVWENI